MAPNGHTRMSSRLDVRHSYPDSSPYVARSVLRNAARQLAERGLASASKWALELLIYIPKSEYDDVKSPRTATMRFNHVDYPTTSETPAAYRHHPSVDTPASSSYPVQSTPAVGPSDLSGGRFASSSVLRTPHSPFIDVGKIPAPPATPFASHDGLNESSSSAHVRFAEHSGASEGAMDTSIQDAWNDAERQNAIEEDVYMLAKCLFDHHQWDRCAAMLEREKVRGPKALFLKLYAKYLVIERNVEEDYFRVSKRQRGKRTHRHDLVPLLRELVDPKDAFLLFLKGVLFRKLGKRIEAIDCFVRSLDVFPYNWSVWQELSTCLEGGDSELQEIASLLPDSFMTSFFCELFARSAAARLQSDEVLRRIDSLLTIFPNAPYLLVCRGQALHLMQELEASEAAYEAARAIDPHRLEGMADYSNSLFVQNKEEKLAHLTHTLAEAGREDAEVCCAVGNYHTLRGDNHRAVEVFKRGVRLDPSLASAWILLGHGYIELKDSIAAAEMYRKALELNPRDVRAWTGLGNTYELNAAWAQALHYHKRAAASSPYDFRFWASMANCYEKLLQPVQAIECYKRILALEHHIDAQLAIMDNVARLYEGLASGDEADDEEDDDEDEEDEEDEDQVDEDGLGARRERHGEAYRRQAKAAAHARDLMRACAWHRRIVELIDRAREDDGGQDDSGEHAARVKEHVGSFLIAARWEMGMVTFGSEEQDVDRMNDVELLDMPATSSGMGDVEYDDEEGHRKHSLQRGQVGNVSLAHDYLQRVMMTGTEAVLEAEELLKRLSLLRT